MQQKRWVPLSLAMFTVLNAVALAYPWACAPVADEPSRGTSVAPLSAASRPPMSRREEGATVMNPYAVPGGDVREAYERAKGRWRPRPILPEALRREDRTGATEAPRTPPGDAGMPANRMDDASSAASRMSPVSPVSPAAGAEGTTAGPALILYDETGPWGWLGELYALHLMALVGHFGAVKTLPVSQYAPGDLGRSKGMVYVGSTFDEPLPESLLDDVLAGCTPVLWMNFNIWQLAARDPGFVEHMGFLPQWLDTTSEVAQVHYKGTMLTRYLPNPSGLMTYTGETTAPILAEAVRRDGSRLPWALRGNNLIYIGENPLVYVSSDDRYLAFTDLLFEIFAPTTPERHRALVRIEDVSPASDVRDLKALANYLSNERIPFSVATIPDYEDPLGAYNGGTAQSMRMSNDSALLQALRYMMSRGGTLIMHGWTHQFDVVQNPYSAVTGEDFEFYRTHIDGQDNVIYDGPVPVDTEAWAAQRIESGLNEFQLGRLPRPTTFEFPHYAGSVPDAWAVRRRFSTVYHRGLYFGGQLRGETPRYDRPIGVFFPFKGKDVFGFDVLPENLGGYHPEAFNNHPPRLVADLVATALANRVVRDGVASFYFHAYHPLSVLKQLVKGLRAAGYEFVAASAL